MPAPASDAEQLVWNVLEAERQSISQVHEKSLMDANMSFLTKHKDSLMHRAAVAEMLCLLDPSKKSEAVKLIEESSDDVFSINGAFGRVGQWKLKDCVAVHKLLESVLVDNDAASRWKTRCAEFFPHSVYFEGCKSSAVSNACLNMTWVRMSERKRGSCSRGVKDNLFPADLHVILRLLNHQKKVRALMCESCTTQLSMCFANVYN
ncbi:N-terminal acetyltransferase A complex auxiliary subunit NAA15-like [Chenopodium quinoa]|uniref:N-terminal acetyltransferase A complex auxiliary subunit NAA15-like n=1 Tax=Chenopodium quinoa TaxID=63459 RepID=UPI000B7952F0|nr:N-terminal acetyltransferase A complex auxiliary subunit NAA15-like [Chenopodium quinoa]